MAYYRMSPIENVVPNLVPEPTQTTNIEIRNKQDRSRDLFGVQLEVTSLLLEAERRKLAVLQKELQVALEEGGSIKAKEHQKQELLIAIARIQSQYDHLDKEYREHALGALLSANTRGSGKVQCGSVLHKMQELNEKSEKPKILGPKPNIATKPKHVPPVNLVKGQKINRDDVSKTNLPRQTNANNDFRHQQKEMPKEMQIPMDKSIAEKIYDKRAVTGSAGTIAESFQSYIHIQRPTNFPCSIADTYGDSNQDYEKHSVSYSEYTSYYSEKCDKYKTTCESHKPDDNHKQPASPSTVCCSILSNTSSDCCGIIVNAAKKELNGKTLTKVESTDSNSSDSGGFKDFVQLDLTKPTNQIISHQRKISQPEFLEKSDYVKPYTHQRNSSQPDYISSEIRQPLITTKQVFVANAQALAQYLPQTEHKFLCKTNSGSTERSEDIRQVVPKLNVAQVSQMFNEKTDENKAHSKPRPQIISQSQFQQSTKKIEELLSQRLEKEKLARKGQNCLIDGEASQDIEHKMVIQKQIQQKLHADLQQTVKQIQEIQSLELRLPQNRRWNESNRSQPAIGLKHTPKSRVSAA
ncbi:hypothetical protein Trydic_g16237 [Trypoxylus dichotomus]